VKLEHELGRLLEIGGNRGKIVAVPALQAGGNRRERSEISTELDQPRPHRPRRQLLAQNAQGGVGAPVDHEDHFERIRHPRRERLELAEQAWKALLVVVDRNDEGQHVEFSGLGL
jgi:hypothetical protein